MRRWRLRAVEGVNEEERQMSEKPNCYECTHRRPLAGDAHSRCNNHAAKVQGDTHGIRSGWFLWPLNFDPVWLKSCDGFSTDAKDRNALSTECEQLKHDIARHVAICAEQANEIEQLRRDLEAASKLREALQRIRDDVVFEKQSAAYYQRLIRVYRDWCTVALQQTDPRSRPQIGGKK